MAGDKKKPLRVLYICADEDLPMLTRLDRQLSTLKSNDWIECWHESNIAPGSEKVSTVQMQINAADVILLLISADFMASDWCFRQTQWALDRYNNGQVVVIPIILRPVDWYTSILGKLRALPKNGQPITTWSNLDNALFDVANGIQIVVKILLKGVYIASVAAESSFVARLQHDLEQRGLIVWCSPEGQSAEREEILKQTIRASQIVVFIASPNTKYAKPLKEELRIAQMYQRRIVPLWVAGNAWPESVPPQFVRQSFLDARTPEAYDNSFVRIITLYEKVEELHESGSKTSTLTFSSQPALSFQPRNPYKALNAFTGSDTDIRDFFGREKLTGALLEAVKGLLTVNQNAHFLAVIGPSGAGKSSVVMAGLLPQLKQGHVPGSENWVYLRPMVPGTHPVETLALVLANEKPDESVKAIRDDLAAIEARGLYWQAFKMVKSQNVKVVLVVDQFEELFTQPSEQERRQFIDLLVTAATEPQSPVIVLVTLRADFYDRPMSYPDLSQLIEAHHKVVPPMEVDEMLSIIEGPAALPDVQLTFADNLVGDLLFEMRGQPGALPLLEFTLDQLFQRRQGQQLTRKAYEQIGGLRGALAKRAEETYTALPSDEHRRLTRVLFLRLIDLGATPQDTTRRRAPLREFVLPDSGQTAMLKAIRDAFIRERLLVITDENSSETILEVSHEALIREWPRLADWLTTGRNDILLQEAISKDASEWIRYGKSEDRLYRGTQLAESQAWAARNVPSTEEVDFIQDSARDSAQRQVREEERLRKELELQQRATRRQRYIIGLTGIISMIIAVALVVTLVLQGRLASINSQLTTTNKQLANANVQLQRSLPVSVTNLSDNGSGSLRQAIATASPGSTITFKKGLNGTIFLKSSLVINKNVSIRGPDPLPSSPWPLSISVKDLTVNSTYSSVFVIGTQGIVTFSNLALVDNNFASEGGAILSGGVIILTHCQISRNHVSGDGGAIINGGALILLDSTVSNNSAAYTGGGIVNTGNLIIARSTISGNQAKAQNDAIGGGGILNEGMLTLTDSTVSGNISGSYGGGITSNGTLTVDDSTISGNTSVYGGGIFIGDGQVSITYTTIYNNSASQQGGGIGMLLTNNGQDAANQVMLIASIVGGNQAGQGSDIFGVVTLEYVNLIQAAPNQYLKILYGTNPLDPNANTLAKHLIFGQTPLLGPLQNNGGPTDTDALLQGSQAINAIPLNSDKHCTTELVAEQFDQRGVPRPLPNETGCDLGAVEHQP